MTNTRTTETAHPFARHLQVGDVILTAIASSPNIIYTDTVEDVWQYDEMIYVRSAGEAAYLRYSLDDVVSVIRPPIDMPLEW